MFSIVIILLIRLMKKGATIISRYDCSYALLSKFRAGPSPLIAIIGVV